MIKVDDGQTVAWTTDNNQSHKLIMSALCLGELKTNRSSCQFTRTQ